MARTKGGRTQQAAAAAAAVAAMAAAAEVASGAVAIAAAQGVSSSDEEVAVRSSRSPSTAQGQPAAASPPSLPPIGPATPKLLGVTPRAHAARPPRAPPAGAGASSSRNVRGGPIRGVGSRPRPQQHPRTSNEEADADGEEKDDDEGEAAEQVRCGLCPKANRSGGTLPSAMLGLFSSSSGKQTVMVHHVCALWAAEVYWDEEADQLRNVYEAYHRGRQLQCGACHDRGATVGCSVAACPLSYHYCCLPSGACFINAAEHSALCPSHAAAALAASPALPLLRAGCPDANAAVMGAAGAAV